MNKLILLSTLSFCQAIVSQGKCAKPGADGEGSIEQVKDIEYKKLVGKWYPLYFESKEMFKEYKPECIQIELSVPELLTQTDEVGKLLADLTEVKDDMITGFLLTKEFNLKGPATFKGFSWGDEVESH